MAWRCVIFGTAKTALLSAVVMVSAAASLGAAETPADPPPANDKTGAEKTSVANKRTPPPPAAGKEIGATEETAATSATNIPEEEIVVTATRTKKHIFEVPQATDIRTADDLRHRLPPRSLPEALRELPGVSVQKTAQGQGSPFIRGMTGFHDVMLIDGVRFNNSVFRSGPNQYWATIDPLTLKRLEVVRGPGSVLYGSDAVGGTVNAVTQSAELPDGKKFGGRAYYRLGLAERSNIGRVEVQGRPTAPLDFIFGGSFKDHDDFVAGGGTGVVENSGYEEYGLDGKLRFRPADGHELTFAVQRFHQEEVPRTEKTVYSKSWQGTRVGNELRRDQDQDRLFSYLKYRVEDLGPALSEAELTFSYQWTQEERFRIRGNGREDHQGLEVNTFGAQAQLGSETPVGRLTYGFEYYRDFVDSWRKDFNADGSLRGIRIQGSVGDDSTYDLLGIYAQNEADIFDRRVTLTAGGRFTYARLRAGRVADPVTGDEISLSDQWTNLVGSFRFVVRPDLESGDHWRVFGGVSQAFRAPNLSDVTSFDATSAVETPTSGLSPEKYLSFEIGTRARYATVSWSAAYFHTFIRDQIVQSPTGVLIDDTPEVQKSNVGRGFIKGIETAAAWNFLPRFTLWNNLTWTEGEVDQYEDGVKRRKPYSRLIPAVGNFGLRYDLKDSDSLRWWAEAHGTAATKADRLALRDRTDTRRISPGGTPGYAVFGVRGGVKLVKERLTLSAGIDNLANVEYRVHGSGRNEPGLNFFMTVDWEF